MQSYQFKSDSLNSNLNLNTANLDGQIIRTDSVSTTLNLLDPSFNDSLSVNYIAPDSVIIYGFRPEWSQFRKEFIPKFDYRKDLVKPLPYDSLYTVLKGVEVVFPGKKVTLADWRISFDVCAVCNRQTNF